MPKKPSRNLFVRWADATAGDDVDRAIGNLFRAVPLPAPMSRTDLEATRRELLAASQRRSRRSGVPRATLLVAAILGAATSALAEWAHPGWWHLAARPAVQAIVATRDAEPVKPLLGLPRETIVPPASVVAPEAARDPVEVVSEWPKAVGGVARVPGSSDLSSNRATAGSSRHSRDMQADLPAAPSPSPQRSTLALESESLEPALVALRRNHDAAYALSLLDAHEMRYPRGQLATEAMLARMDALLLLGRRSEALQSLERVPLGATSLRPELVLLRAELRADADCRRALVDFDIVLAEQPAPSLDERALYGRAGCRLREGDRPGAESDLRTYLSRYPAGRFADQVRAHLAH